MSLLAAVRCLLRGYRTTPVRNILGGFRCAECGVVGADFEDMGWGAGYVLPVRRIYARDRDPVGHPLGTMTSVGWSG